MERRFTPLPKDVLLNRIKNELLDLIKYCEHRILILVHGTWVSLTPQVIDTINQVPVFLYVYLKGIKAYVYMDGKIDEKDHHEMVIKITRNYPYEKPVVRWQSDIFHPNIMPPEDGGRMCTKLLDNWGFRSTLLEFIKGVETLLTVPNPGNPFGTPMCTMAAEYYNTVIKKKVRRGPRILKEYKSQGE